MNGNYIGGGLILWVLGAAIYALGITGHLGFAGGIAGLVLTGLFGIIGLGLIIAGLASTTTPKYRTCYICGVALTSADDYRRHFDAVHPGKDPDAPVKQTSTQQS